MRKKVTNPKEQLRWYDEAGMKLVRVSKKTKKCIDDEWQNSTLPLEELISWVESGGNVEGRSNRVWSIVPTSTLSTQTVMTIGTQTRSPVMK